MMATMLMELNIYQKKSSIWFIPIHMLTITLLVLKAIIIHAHVDMKMKQYNHILGLLTKIQMQMVT